MRFGFIHRLMTNALAALGLLALATSGELNGWVSGAILLGLVAAIIAADRWSDSSFVRRSALFGPLLLLGVQAARLSTGAAALPLAVEFAAGLQIVRLATRRGAAHDQQVIVLAMLHLVAGTVLGGGLAYGLCFLGFLIIAPGALVLSHLRREVEGNYRQGARDRTGLPVDVPRILRSRRVIGRHFLAFTCVLSVPIFIFTAALFVLFPRVGLSLFLLNHARPQRMVGFSDKVDLGGVGTLRTDHTLAMRVEYESLPENPPARLALYLRGSAFDYYNGTSWARTQVKTLPADRAGRDVPIRRHPDPVRDRHLLIDLEPIEPSVLFLPIDAVALRIAQDPSMAPLRGTKVYAGPEDRFTYVNAGRRGIRYAVFLAGQNEAPIKDLTPVDRGRYLALPPDLTPRVARLAQEWTLALTDPEQQAQAIEKHLREEYRYDLNSPSGAATNPLENFLFESRRGHCEFYSTAMAILLRTLDVPTRNVTGFVGGTYNRFGHYYAVRQGDAHSWVEVFLNGRGWTRFDPTPPAAATPINDVTGALAFMRDVVEATAQRWDRHVVGYDLKQQTSLLNLVSRRYGNLRDNSPFLQLIGSRPFGIGLLLVFGAGYAFWYLRKWRRSRQPKAGERALLGEQARDVVLLYQELENVLALRGAPRPPGTPPLRHAETLVALRHPVAQEALDLTRRYLEVRFGGGAMSDAEQQDYKRRVKRLRLPELEPLRAA